MSVKSKIFDEFLADIITILYFGDPEVIFNSLDFDEGYRHHFRKVGFDVTEAYLPRIKETKIDITIISKNFLWRQIYSRYLSGQFRPLTFDKLIQKIFAATVSAFGVLTNDFTLSSELMGDPVQLNRVLIESLAKEFNIAPQAPVVGIP